MTKITLQDGKVLLRGGKVATEQACCCAGPCGCPLVYQPYRTNRFGSNHCCAYLNVTVSNGSVTRTVPTPIGITTNTTWQGEFWGDGNGEFRMVSECRPAGWLDWLLGVGELRGEPSSIVMEFNPSEFGPVTIVEIFRDENCCPTSIQTYFTSVEGYENSISDITLEFGPAVFEDYFFDGWLSFGASYDLYFCGNPPTGLCCVQGAYNIGYMTEYECLVGGPIGPGEQRTWHADPESAPCAIGACCYNDGTADVCDAPISKAECDALGGTFHSGQSCDPDQQIVTLAFSSTQFGSGGGGIATAPVGTPGPITAVSITSPGSGYAQVVRVVPSLTASVSGGTGATLSVSLAANGTTPQTWGVSGVTVTGTTSGYTDNAAVSFSYGGDVTEQTKATATIKTTRTAPTITASAGGSGSGASLSVSLSQSPTSPSDTALWHVASVAVTAGGSGYADGDPVTFTVSDGTQVAAASGTITTAKTRGNPNLTPYVWGDDGTTAGTGAVVTATMNATTDGEGKPAWEVASLSIVNGGSGYEVGEYFWYEELDPGITSSPPYYVLEVDGWWITSVDGNGAITGIGLDPNGGTNGLFYKDTSIGAIQSISVTSGGDYYKADSAISRVVVNDAGKYYREEVSVAGVTVAISQAAGYNGTGASITATVDSDKTSGTFGQVTALTIANGGSGYVAVVPADDPCNLFP